MATPAGVSAAPPACVCRRRSSGRRSRLATIKLRSLILLLLPTSGSGLYTFYTTAKLQSALSAWHSNPTTAALMYGHISTWNVGLITDMAFLFDDAQSFNEDITSWDVSKVINMVRAFRLLHATTHVPPIHHLACPKYRRAYQLLTTLRVM